MKKNALPCLILAAIMAAGSAPNIHAEEIPAADLVLSQDQNEPNNTEEDNEENNDEELELETEESENIGTTPEKGPDAEEKEKKKNTRILLMMIWSLKTTLSRLRKIWQNLFFLHSRMSIAPAPLLSASV